MHCGKTKQHTRTFVKFLNHSKFLRISKEQTLTLATTLFVARMVTCFQGDRVLTKPLNSNLISIMMEALCRVLDSEIVIHRPHFWSFVQCVCVYVTLHCLHLVVFRMMLTRRRRKSAHFICHTTIASTPSPSTDEMGMGHRGVERLTI